jgi:large subunit ribosomal protein L24
MKIIKGDNVLVILGKDRGKTGTVEKVVPRKGKIIVTGLNLAKKHTRPTRRNPKGGITEIPALMDASNVSVICKKCGKTTRIAYKIAGGKKSRICKKCMEAL